MKHVSQRLGPAALAAALALGLPAQAWAQQQTVITGSQTAMFQSAVRNQAATTPRLAKMQEVAESVVRLIPVEGMAGGGRRRTMGMRTTGDRAALQAALEKATVEEHDRPNGVDMRQNTFSDYLQQHQIDPKSVLAVSITDNPDDKQNPFVNVFYRKSSTRTTM